MNPSGSEPGDPADIGSTVADVDDLLASSPVVLYSATLRGERLVPVWVSGNLARILGYSVEEALAPGWWYGNVHPEDREQASRSGASLLAQQHQQYTHEYRFRHANGAYVRVLDQIRIIERGGARVAVGSWTDVSAVRAQQEQLEEAHAHYHRLIHTSPYAIYTLDSEGRFTELNAAAERLLGTDDRLGVSFADIIATEDLELGMQFFAQVMSGRHESLERELRIRRADGEHRLLSVTAAPIRAEGVIGVHGIARDITDERRIEQERERARQQYERLVTTSPDAIYALDLEGRFTEVSRAAAELIGRSVDELIGMRFSAIVAPEDLAAAAAAFQRRIGGATEISEFDIHIIRKDGERRLLRIRGTDIRDGDRVLGSQGIGRDITEERKREERMALLSTALDRLPDGVCITNEQHRLVYANSACFHFLGTNLETAETIDEFVESAGLAPTLAAMRDALEQYGAWRGTITHATDTHDAHPIEIIAVYVFVDEQRLTFSVLRDLSAEVAREQQLRRAERLASVGTLVAGVAHELNNPLTAIGGFAELMLMEPQSDENREMLQLTMREATRAARIVADLRLLARETQHDVPSSRGPVDVNDVVDHVLKLQRYTLDTSNIEVEVDLAEDLPAVHANAAELEQVVLNLIVNARQALDEKHATLPRIIVRTRPSNSGATLRIADNGPGIPPHHLERIFDPFFTTKSPGEGMGLGLSL
ncbi:MAG TPA: PAS domain S-box protein, partial [Longimicrobiales bacterium]|nr:PAS domain S-box protein [Longimicrobiales bacterium]